jgi:hypothetical protein
MRDINAYEVFVRKPERRLRYKWEDNILKNLKVVACECVHCIELAWDRIHWWTLLYPDEHDERQGIS